MKKIYNIFIIVITMLSIFLVFLDIFGRISISHGIFYWIDKSILIFFSIDYIIRFSFSKEKLNFFKSNIFDLIAIIPYDSIFSIFRTVRLFRLLKFARYAKALRLLGFLGKLKTKIKKFLRTNGFIYAIYCAVGLILLSSIVMMYAEKQSFSDALWWSIVTCTTVGYGDISPSSAIGRIIAVILMLFGIGLIGMLTSTITAYCMNCKFTASGEDKKLEELISNMSDENKSKLIEIAKILER